MQVLRRLGRGRRRAVVLATAVIAGTVGATGGSRVSFAAPPSRPLSRDLSSYVLFAFETLSFKGGERAGRGVIAGGDVGAGGVDPHPDDSQPVLSICANHAVTMEDGAQVAAHTMRITARCDVWDVYANTVNPGSDVVPRNAGPVAFSLPLLAGLPPFPAFACDPGTPFTAPEGGAADLAPGTYGDVRLKDGSHTALSPGVYTLCNLEIGRRATVVTGPGVELRIARTFAAANDATFGPACAVPVYVRAGGATGPHDVAVSLGKSTVVSGRFLTLRGRIALGDGNDLFGSFFGKEITSDKNVNVTGCDEPPPPTTSTTTTSPTTDAEPTTSTTGATTTTIRTVVASTSTTIRAGVASTAVTTARSFVSARATPPATTPARPGPHAMAGGLPLTGGGRAGLDLALVALAFGGALLGGTRRLRRLR
jgi:hypothetical protein